MADDTTIPQNPLEKIVADLAVAAEKKAVAAIAIVTISPEGVPIPMEAALPGYEEALAGGMVEALVGYAMQRWQSWGQKFMPRIKRPN